MFSEITLLLSPELIDLSDHPIKQSYHGSRLELSSPLTINIRISINGTSNF
jgi:hypothetical protein